MLCSTVRVDILIYEVVKMTYSITFTDGTKLSGLTFLEGCFFSDTEIDPAIFDGKNLKNVIIEHDDDPILYDRDDVPIPQKDPSGQFAYMKLENFSHLKQDIVAYEIPGQEPVRDKQENWQFYLHELTEEEIRNINIDARLDYLEMMTGV